MIEFEYDPTDRIDDTEYYSPTVDGKELDIAVNLRIIEDDKETNCKTHMITSFKLDDQVVEWSDPEYPKLMELVEALLHNDNYRLEEYEYFNSHPPCQY